MQLFGGCVCVYTLLYFILIPGLGTSTYLILKLRLDEAVLF